MAWIGTPSQSVSSFDQRVTQWMSVWTCLRGSSLNCSQVSVNGASTSPKTLKSQVARSIRGHGAVVEDREFLGAVLAGRDALGDGGIGGGIAEEAIEHGAWFLVCGGLRSYRRTPSMTDP